MRVLKIVPGKAPITINIENTLESLQDFAVAPRDWTTAFSHASK